MMAEAILRSDSLIVGYGGTPVISGIDLGAEAGKILTLIGPNGAGKSTILKTLIKQLPPVSGAVYLDGQELSTLKARDIALKVSAVLTGRPNPELMTCGDVVATGRYPYTGRLGILSDHDREVAAESMELVQVTELKDRDFNRISDGQRQRVLLARAICQEPRVLIMDEPTSFLDIRHKLDFLYLLRKLVLERQLAIVLSLHELELAQRFSDTVLCVRGGKVDRIGPPEEIFRGNYIAELYGVEHGSYNAELGCVETEAVQGTPRVFVVGGGGSGIPTYRLLQRRGIPFAAGVLPLNDADLPIAMALATEVVTDKAFEPVSAEAVSKALALAETCEKVVCAAEGFGTMTAENRRILTWAEEMGKLLPPEALNTL